MKNIILIVEDSRSFALSLEAAVRQGSSFDVLVALNYAQACQMLEKYKEEIFLAITDLNLPDAEPGDAAKLMATNNILCIAFTGNFSRGLREEVLSLGVSDYVLKNDKQDIDYVVNMINRMSNNQNIGVLVVDDSSSSRELLSALLEKQCYQVTVAASGKEALKLLAQGAQFRILLIDIVMEDMDGFQLLKALRKKHDVTQMSIIGISGKADSIDVAKFMKYGGNDFLTKPIEQEQLCCRVNTNAQLLDQFDNLNQLNLQKNELLGMAAHDIRGPLGVVMSGCSMLKKEVSTEHGRMLVDLTSEAANNMEALLDQLLDYSAIESASISINKTHFNLTELLDQIVKETRLLASDKQQNLIIDPMMETVWIRADSMRIKEVVQNLISNAIKYSQMGGNIELAISNNHKKARVEVIDEAGGVPDDEVHLLFEPFNNISTQPTDGERSTGLGLSICQRIMELHGGKVKYRSNKHIGSIFEVIIPCIEEH